MYCDFLTVPVTEKKVEKEERMMLELDCPG